MDRETIRYNAIMHLQMRYGNCEVICWYPRRPFDAYYKVYVRVNGRRMPVNVRVYDGGMIEEIGSVCYLNSESN